MTNKDRLDLKNLVGLDASSVEQQMIHAGYSCQRLPKETASVEMQEIDGFIIFCEKSERINFSIGLKTGQVFFSVNRDGLVTKLKTNEFNVMP